MNSVKKTSNDSEMTDEMSNIQSGVYKQCARRYGSNKDRPRALQMEISVKIKDPTHKASLCSSGRD